MKKFILNLVLSIMIVFFIYGVIIQLAIIGYFAYTIMIADGNSEFMSILFAIFAALAIPLVLGITFFVKPTE